MILETYARVFVDAGTLERTVSCYRALLGGEETPRFAYPQTQMEFVAVSSPRLSALIIAGGAEARRPFEATRLTVKVDALESVLDTLAAAGAEPLEPIQPTLVGRKTRFRHIDGLMVEYIDNTAAREA